MKKLISLLLAAMLVVSSMGMVVFAKNETEVSTDYAVNTLCDLNFLIGDEAGNLQLDKPVTRAEFATILLRVLGLSEVNAPVNGQTFTDVPQTHWAAGIVSHCANLGIINGYGNGMFGPDDYVEYQDAITMMVRTLGYEPAVGSAGYPTGYLTKAGELSLINGVNGYTGTPILRKDIAHLIFNSLDVPLMTQSGFGTFTQYVINDGYSAIKKTLLSEKHNIVKLQALVTKASYQTSTSSTAKDKVTLSIINDYKSKFEIPETVFVGNTNIEKYIGKEVILFVEYNEFENTATVKSFYETFNNDKLVIDLADIVSFDNNEIKYYVNDTKTATVSVDAAATYYNGILDGAIPNNIKEMSGYIELTLTNDECLADYDTVFITAYDVFIVDEVRTNSKVVSSKTSTGVSRIKYDEDDNVVAKLTNGKWEDLEEYDVLMVKYVDNGIKDFYEATLVENTVSGIVEEISDDYVVINGNEYKVLSCAIEEDKIKLGDEGTYYLDINDNIVYHNATITKSDNYAYVINAAEATEMDNAQIKMLTKENEIITVDVAKKITLIKNGEKENNKKDYNYSDLVGKVITYKVNASGMISTIEIAVDSDDEDVFTLDYSAVDMTDYDEDAQSFRVDGKKHYIDNSTVIFNVYGDEEDFEVIALKNLADGQVLYGADLYNIDEDRVIGVIALKTANSIRPTMHNATFITKISSTVDEDGYDVYRVSGYVDGESVSYICDEVDDSIIGKLVTPVYKANGDVKEFNLSVDEDSEYVIGSINKDSDFKHKCLTINDEEYKINNSVNIYVYNETLKSRTKYDLNQDFSYVEYDDEEKVWYVDGEEYEGTIEVILYIYDGDVVDLVYYIY